MTRPTHGTTLSSDPRGPAESALDETLSLVGRMAAILEEHLDALAELAPRLAPVRRLEDGAWVLGLAADREQAGAAFGRLVFHLRVSRAGERLRCDARSSAAGRDRTTRQLDVPLDDAAAEQLRAFAEGAVLDFAREYFASDPATSRSASS